MIENEEETAPYPNHPPQPKVDPTDKDEATIQPADKDEAATQLASAEPRSNVATTVHQSEQPVSAQPKIESAVATIQVPASTISPQPEATVAPDLPYMNINDLLALKIVSDPQISPDGTMIAFVLQHNNVAENTTGSSIWLVSSAGGKNNPPRPLTSGMYHDTTPRWSPHGQAK